MGSLWSTNPSPCETECFKNIPNYTEFQFINNHMDWLFTQKHIDVIKNHFIKHDFIHQIITSFLMNKTQMHKDIISMDENTYNVYGHLLITPFNNNFICDHFFKQQAAKNKSLRRKYLHMGNMYKDNQVKIMVIGSGAGDPRHNLLHRFTTQKNEKLEYYNIDYEGKKTIGINVDMKDFDICNENDDTCSDMVEFQLVSPTIRDQASRILDFAISFQDIVLICINEFEKWSMDFVTIEMRRIIKQFEKKTFVLVRIKDEIDNCDNILTKEYKDELEKFIKEVKVPYVEVHIESGKNVNTLFRLCVYEYWMQSQCNLSRGL
eukprot:287347_1